MRSRSLRSAGAAGCRVDGKEAEGWAPGTFGRRCRGLRPYLAPYRESLIWLLVLTVLAAALGLAEPWPLAVILNNVLRDSPADRRSSRVVFGSDPTTWVVLVSMVLAAVPDHRRSATASPCWNHYLGAKIEQNMVLDLRSDLFAHVQRLSLTFHDRAQDRAR